MKQTRACLEQICTFWSSPLCTFIPLKIGRWTFSVLNQGSTSVWEKCPGDSLGSVFFDLCFYSTEASFFAQVKVGGHSSDWLHLLALKKMWYADIVNLMADQPWDLPVWTVLLLPCPLYSGVAGFDVIIIATQFLRDSGVCDHVSPTLLENWLPRRCTTVHEKLFSLCARLLCLFLYNVSWAHFGFSPFWCSHVTGLKYHQGTDLGLGCSISETYCVSLHGKKTFVFGVM